MEFNRPIHQARNRDTFSPREVGMYHPDLFSFIKLNDMGQIEIFATSGLGIVLDPHTRSCNIHADTVKFFTKEIDGLRWNDVSFNSKAVDFREPAFNKFLEEDIVHHLDGWNEFLEE